MTDHTTRDEIAAVLRKSMFHESFEDMADEIIAAGVVVPAGLTSEKLNLAALLIATRGTEPLDDFTAILIRELRGCAKALLRVPVIEDPKAVLPALTAEALREIADDYELVIRSVGGLPRDRVLSTPITRRLNALRAWADELREAP